MKNKTAIVVAGPTAIGKTKVAIHLALHYGTEIISTDSRQCFKEMSIGTAVPSKEELRQVPHHFIQSHSVTTSVNAGIFEEYALKKADDIFAENDILVTCGGTGLYNKAFCEGIDAIPEVPETIKAEIEDNYHRKGISWLQQQMREKTPETYLHAEQHNPQRLMRALGVFNATGHPIQYYQTGIIRERPFNLIKIGLHLPRDQQWKNIKTRIDQMVSDGLIDEVQSLIPYRHLNALQTTGYQEIFDYLDGKYSLEEALEQVYFHTRQYAKRQITWLKREKDLQWFSPLEEEKIISYINHQLTIG